MTLPACFRKSTTRPDFEHQNSNLYAISGTTTTQNTPDPNWTPSRSHEHLSRERCNIKPPMSECLRAPVYNFTYFYKWKNVSLNYKIVGLGKLTRYRVFFILLLLLLSCKLVAHWLWIHIQTKHCVTGGVGCWSVLAWDGCHHVSQPMRAFGEVCSSAHMDALN